MAFIYSYKMGSNSAKALQKELGLKMIRHEGSHFVGGPNKRVLNWGSSDLPEQVKRSKVINNLDAVRIAGNKLSTLKKLAQAGVSIPEYTDSQEVASKWLENQGKTVVARKVLNGHSGIGIEIMEPGVDFVEAMCYTVYVPKSAEYRLHIFKKPDGTYHIADVQRKVKNPDRDVKDWKVRSHANGFIFVRQREDGRVYKEVLEEDVRKQGLAAVPALGLEFGAVDVIYNKKLNKAFVLECNCAPGLEGTTLETYKENLKWMLQ